MRGRAGGVQRRDGQGGFRGVRRGTQPAAAQRWTCAPVTIRRLLLLLSNVMIAGCSGNPAQSALHPASPDARYIAWLWWGMLVAFSAVFVLVLVLLGLALFRQRVGHDAAPPLGRTGFILWGGVALPLVMLLPLYIFSLETSAALRVQDAATTIRVVGYRWWWKVEYPESGIVTANELHIPVGKPVKLQLFSADVIHSFWVPSLHGKRDMIPGIPTEFWLRAERPGIYRGQCAEYCGTQHANMAFLVVALPEDEYEQWLASQQETSVMPQTQAQRRGQQVFFEAGCARCHAIKDTDARGDQGPDLTHIGSRHSLGAGLLRPTPGNLAGWIGDAPSLKPGVLMPPMYLEPGQLFDLVAYLESLK